MLTRDILVFSSYVTLIPLQHVPLFFYQDMESLVLDIRSLNADKFYRHTGRLHATLPAKLALVTNTGPQVDIPTGHI